MTDLLPLFNIEAEQATLGACAIDLEAIEKVRPFLKPEHFYRESHKWAYEAILSLHDRNIPVDLITLTEELHARKQLGDVGGVVFVSGLTNRIPTALHVEHYARIVSRDAMRRRVVGASEELRKLAYDAFAEADEAAISAQSQSVIERATSLELGAKGATGITQSIGWLLQDLEDIEAGIAVPGLPVSLPSLRSIISCWRRGLMVTVAARTSQGKSALMNHEAVELAKVGHAGLFIGLEMSIEFLTARALAHLADLDSLQVIDGWKKRDNAIDPANGRRIFPHRAQSWAELKERVWEAQQTWEGLPLTFVSFSERDKTIQPPRTPRATRAFIKAHAARNPVDFIIHDYLGLMDYSPARTSSEVSRAIGDGAMFLKRTAEECGAVLFAVHQLSREAARSDRPALHHLAECGHLENHSDIALFIHDEEKAGKKGAPKNHKELIIHKQRRGPTGFVDDVRVIPETGLWYCEADQYQQEQAERYGYNGRENGGRYVGDF